MKCRNQLPSDSEKHRPQTKSWLPYLLVVGIVTFLFFITMIRCELYPFGDQSLATSDARNQYINFYSYFRDSLFSDNDLNYSFSTVLGGNIQGLYSYYLGSPLYLLFALFPEEQILLALHLITYLKFLFAGLAFCAWAGYQHKQNLWMRVSLSVCYAFIGYNVTFYSLLSWLDAVALLPLVAMGLEKLVRERRPLTYIFSLALAIISNYYIGFAICLLSVLIYVILLIIDSDGVIRYFRQTILLFSMSSLLSGMLSAWTLLPAALSLPESRMQSAEEAMIRMRGNFPFLSFFSKLFTGTTSADQFFNGLPTVFFGMIPLVLVVLFFLNPHVRFRYRILAGSILLALFLSFHNSFINIIWHGFTRNRMFNYRYSFVFSFFALAIAWHSVCHWRTLTSGAFARCFVAIVFGALLVFNTTYEYGSTTTLYFDLLITILGLALILYAARGHQVAAGILGCLMFINCLANTTLSISNIQREFGPATHSGRNSFLADVRKGLDLIPPEDDFCRIEKTFHQTTCDNMALGIPGASNYSSVEQEASMDFTWKLGLTRYIAWSRFSGDNPTASESLLGIRYLLSKDSLRSGRETYTLIGTTDDGTSVYRNPYALPIVMTSSSLLPVLETGDGFQYQNACWRSLRPAIDTDIFIQAERVKTQIAQTGNTYMLTYKSPKTGAAYLHFPGSYTANEWPFSVEILHQADIQKSELLKTNIFQSTYPLGSFEKGETLTLVVKFSSEDVSEMIDDFLVYIEDSEALDTYSREILNSPLNVQKITSSHLEIQCSVNTDTPYMISTIPYDKGWSVLVDGSKVETLQNWNCMLAFSIDPGNHTIELRFHAPGKDVGLFITLASAGIIAAYIILDAKKRRKCIA